MLCMDFMEMFNRSQMQLSMFMFSIQQGKLQKQNKTKSDFELKKTIWRHRRLEGNAWDDV